MILPAKSHIISKMSIGMMLISVCRKTSCLFKNGVSLIACSVGFASLQGQLFVPLHLCIDSHLCRCICALTAICAVASCNGIVRLSLCVLAYRLCATDFKRPCLVRAAAPHSAPFPRKVVWGFGKDAEIERPKALQGCKAHKAFLKG